MRSAMTKPNQFLTKQSLLVSLSAPQTRENSVERVDGEEDPLTPPLMVKPRQCVEWKKEKAI